MKLGNYWVRFSHRDTYNDPFVSYETVCALYDSEENYQNSAKEYEKSCLSYGLANCKRGDNFSRFVGRKLALQHAMKSAEFDRETRKVLWQAYKDSGARMV